MKVKLMAAKTARIKTRGSRRKPRWDADETILTKTELSKKEFDKKLEILGDVFYSLFCQLRKINNNSVNKPIMTALSEAAA